MDAFDAGPPGLAERLVRRAQILSSWLPPAWDRRARAVGRVAVNYRGARRAVVRRWWFALLSGRSRLIAAPFGRARLLVDATDREIAPVVFSTGGYERFYMAAALEALEHFELRYRDTTFVDVGANIGTSTIDALVHFQFARAVCFEPDVENYRLLRMNLVLNDLDDRAVVHQVALSDRDGEVVLERSLRNSGDHRVVVDGHAWEDSKERLPTQVRCRRFDSLVEEGKLAIDDIGLLWVDVQGHEGQVLAGASTAISAGVPIVVEYAPALLQEAATLTLFEEITRARFTTVVDLHLLVSRGRSRAVFDAADVGSLLSSIRGRQHTDLLLIQQGGR